MFALSVPSDGKKEERKKEAQKSIIEEFVHPRQIEVQML